MSNTLNADVYEEMPVSLDEFLDSERYLGKFTNNGKTVYPFWREKLNELFADDASYINMSITGDAESGKTTATVLGIAYLLYRLLCLNNPQEYWGFPQDNKISVAFYNTVQNLAMGTAYTKLHSALCESPWFLEHGTVSNEGYIGTFEPNKGITIDTALTAKGMLGKQVFAVVLDEDRLAKDDGDEDELKAELLKTYSALVARVQSRFTRDGKCYGKLFAISADNNATCIVTDNYLKNKSDTLVINATKSDN